MSSVSIILSEDSTWYPLLNKFVLIKVTLLELVTEAHVNIEEWVGLNYYHNHYYYYLEKGKKPVKGKCSLYIEP